MTTPAVYTIPAGVSFVDALARGIRDAVGDAPENLTRVRVLLPNRRAARALGAAFLRQAKDRPLLLPRMTPLGDLDDDTLLLDDVADAADGIDGGGDSLTQPPAIAPLRRQLLLARLVIKRYGGGIGHDQAARLAQELARLLDQIATERLHGERLATLVPHAFARHWQLTLDFLSIITRAWPAILAEEGVIDPADRRDRLIMARARAWRERPPAEPVYAAGSTGSIPATAELMAVVARLPRGAIVLPGLDKASDAATWQAVADDPCHPQHTMARLLEQIGVTRDQVAVWPGCNPSPAIVSRTDMVRRALAPAKRIGAGPPAPPPDPAAIDGVSRIDCRGAEDEARVIALLMRETLEFVGRTAALVTADRVLARRVAGELGRWGIEVDDSAGMPLADTPPARFLRLVAAMVDKDLAPVPLLAALKHPLAALGVPTAVCRAHVRRLEHGILRGPRPAPGLDGLKRAWTDARADVDGEKTADPVLALLTRLGAAIQAFADIRRHGHAPLADILAAHVHAAEALAATDAETGPARLWAGEAGEAAATFVAELAASADGSDIVAADRYPALFDVLMEGQVVRPRFGRHPRLAIWGPLEARLQHAEVMILGGLNEGVWPPAPEASPWMGRPMMAAFGLPLPERRIGLSAHDFAQAFSAPRVWLTRADRRAGAPTVPSRWLFRLDTALRGTGWEDKRGLAERRWLNWQSALDAPASVIPAAAPKPCPPVAARPRKLSVTQVETWMRDPYALYARHILGLSALDPIDADPDAADYGSIVHRALARFVADGGVCQAGDGGVGLTEDALERLLAAGREEFRPVLDRPAVATFWWPRFERIADWFVAEERQRRPDLSRTVVETRGSLVLDGPAGPFELTAVADRIDLRADGTLDIIDYKTGMPPSIKEILCGFACQLPLEAAIAMAGGFSGIGPIAVHGLEHWRLGGGDPAGKRHPVKCDPATLADEARDGLTALVALFDDDVIPYYSRPYSAFAPRYSDYDHLARVREWSTGAEASE